MTLDTSQELSSSDNSSSVSQSTSLTGAEDSLPFKVYTLSLFRLQFTDSSSLPVGIPLSSSSNPDLKFVTNDYSKFKHGSGAVARVYGIELAKKFIEYYGHLLEEGDNFMVSTSAYKYCPSASTSVTNYFQDYLNWWLYKRGQKKQVNRNQIFRCETTEGDYGKLSSEERQVLMMQNNYAVDTNRLAGSKFIVLDDVRITGAHEQKIQNFLLNSQVDTLFLVYVASFDTPPSDPGVEAKLNNCWMAGKLSNLVKVIDGDFSLNARVCKFLLSYKDVEELSEFLTETIDKALLYKVYNSCIGDGYCSMKEYSRNFRVLEEIYNQRCGY